MGDQVDRLHSYALVRLMCKTTDTMEPVDYAIKDLLIDHKNGQLDPSDIEMQIQNKIIKMKRELADYYKAKGERKPHEY